MTIADEKYVSMTTFKNDGTPRATPTWIADFGDGTIGCTTASSSYKVKRIGKDPRVELRACDVRGNVEDGARTFTGRATVERGAEFEKCRDKVKQKYGIQFRLITAAGAVAGLFRKESGSDCAVKITLDA